MAVYCGKRFHSGAQMCVQPASIITTRVICFFDMNSVERHEKRYQRRKTKRELKRKEFAEKHTEFDDVLGFKALVNSFGKCKNKVMWKASVQAYRANLLTNSADSAQKLRDGTWKSRGFKEFDIIERGKRRHIQSVHISERCIQRALCDNCLVPILSRNLIYDNGACLKEKGTDFALDRFTGHLRSHIREYGVTGGIYFFDFSNYFGNIQNDLLVTKVKNQVKDEKIMDIYKKFVYAFGEIGLGLGSQISQISAIFYPNEVDHYMKDRLRINGYGRYMDDGYIICNDIEKLKQFVEFFEGKCIESGIKLNRKKCRIIKIHKSFSFLKVRFFIAKTGKIVRRISRAAVKKERHRIRKFRGLLRSGKMTLEHICKSFYSWLCSQKRGHSYHIRMNMIDYFNSIYQKEGAHFVQTEMRRRNPVYRKCAVCAQTA